MKYGTPSKLPDGRYFLKVTDDSDGRVFHQVNSVQYTPGENYQVNLKVTDVDFFSALDEQILAQAKESKQSWFGKEVSDETVLSAYQKSVNPDGVLEATLATVKGEVVTTAYDSQKNTIELPTAAQKVDLWLELTGLVFSKRSFEPVWKVIQVRTKTTANKFPREYMFKDDPEDDPMDLL